MLGGVLLLAFSLATLAHSQLCEKYHTNFIKVRISLKAALGSDAYTWNSDEEYLFQSMVAFAMRNNEIQSEYQASDVIICNVTKRVSFFFAVRNNTDNSTVSRSDIASAISKNRNRINSAFLLNDNTLQFVEIPPTLSPTTGSSSTSWLIVFGVVTGIIVIGIVFLIVSGIRQRKRNQRQPAGIEDSEVRMADAAVVGNGIYCDTLNVRGGETNEAYVQDKEALTSL
ncbi:collectrin [Rhinatrema bivittatum]|uniref:collectrin n=1 Tax=Rhinatrema bivittatum TaxID=194408 RepID=UPI00112D6C15|nr:collectrin [Rhinatrema bivittatum]